MASKIATLIAAFIFVGTVTALMTEQLIDQEIDMAPKFKNAINTLETALEKRKLIPNDFHIISLLLKYVEKRISELSMIEEKAISRGTRA